jgi:Uma2 family endonuclease
MNVTTLPKPFTYDDYLALPDDGKRYEIIEGELSMTPAPTPRHQAIQLRLGSLLLAYVDKQPLGRVFISPIDLALSLVDVVQPDVLFIAQGRSHHHRGKKHRRNTQPDCPNFVALFDNVGSARKTRPVPALWAAGILDCRSGG